MTTHDIDWSESIARNTASYLLTQTFREDPMMQLFSDDARGRLANYIANELAEPSLDIYKIENPSIYQAYNYVAFTVIPNSPYGAFGDAFARKVGGLVQKSLYPATWEREYVNPK